MTPSDPEIQEALQRYLAATRTPWSDPAVSALTCINSGWESDVYAFDLAHGPAAARQRAPLVLRVYPGAGARDKSAREFNGMRLLHRAGYPAPEVFLLERDASPFGNPFVLMERIDGQMLWPLLFHGPEADRPHLLTLFCELMVRLHTLDWRPFAPGPPELDAADPSAPPSGIRLAEREMRRWAAIFSQHPIPGFDSSIAWLNRRRELLSAAQPGPVHWDFHPANVIMRSDGAPFVIDWTQIDISDTRFDLGWTLLLIGSIVGPEWRSRVLAEYERLRGEPVRDLDFFEAAAGLKRLYSFALSLSIGAEHLGMRPGAEEIMKENAPKLRNAYSMMHAITGLRVPELDALLGAP